MASNAKARAVVASSGESQCRAGLAPTARHQPACCVAASLYRHPASPIRNIETSSDSAPLPACNTSRARNRLYGTSSCPYGTESRDCRCDTGHSLTGLQSTTRGARTGKVPFIISATTRRASSRKEVPKATRISQRSDGLFSTGSPQQRGDGQLAVHRRARRKTWPQPPQSRGWERTPGGPPSARQARPLPRLRVDPGSMRRNDS